MDPEELKQLVRDALTEAAHQGEVLDREELRSIMHDAVVEGMSSLGIDARHPMDVQKDMQFVRELRMMSEKVKQKTYLTMVVMVLGAIATVVVLGIQAFFLA